MQRASGARVVIGSEMVASFDGPGLVVLIGVTHDDTPERARRLAAKVHDLRIFDPSHSAAPVEDGRRELSASELGLPVIVVSQFTLYGDTRKGRRPTWTAAAPGPVAEPLVLSARRPRRRPAVRPPGAAPPRSTWGAVPCGCRRRG